MQTFDEFGLGAKMAGLVLFGLIAQFRLDKG
jgi:hypothetical protein